MPIAPLPDAAPTAEDTARITHPQALEDHSQIRLRRLIEGYRAASVFLEGCTPSPATERAQDAVDRVFCAEIRAS